MIQSEPIITVEDLFFAYKRDNWVLQNVNFDIQKGEIIGIVGKSGSGKTTLCYTLKGIIPHTIKGSLKGIIIVNQFVVRKTQLARLASIIGMVFQEINTQLFANTVREEVQFGLKNLKMDAQLAETALDALQLQPISNVTPLNLSMGQKQRVVLASIIAMQPKVLILDEPSVHLDTQNKWDLKNWLLELNKKWDMTIIIASNDPWLIGNTCEWVLHLTNGEIERKIKSDVMKQENEWNWKGNL